MRVAKVRKTTKVVKHFKGFANIETANIKAKKCFILLLLVEMFMNK